MCYPDPIRFLQVYRAGGVILAQAESVLVVQGDLRMCARTPAAVAPGGVAKVGIEAIFGSQVRAKLFFY